jgi:hypothetical protein
VRKWDQQLYDKNLFWDDLNVLKQMLFVKSKIIEDYRLESSMFGQNDWSMTSGSNIELGPFGCLANRQADPPRINRRTARE